MSPTERFEFKWNERGLQGGDPDTEYVFDGGRKWRFDYAWPRVQVAVEIDGFGYGHQAQQAISNAYEKQNAAVASGWVVLRYSTRCLGSKQKAEDAIDQLVGVISDRGTGKI